ncbi:hypothetical protein C0W35_11115 [Photobacterium kishitanii]|uniref:dynamin family protein n=1 Tax=Photobacterium kishitanii TaxID=318456 RepID=UPI000D167A25|nr:dynamin family protein [Photobacterium kishitanii]PSU93750.1 hypothetical protein C0W35_11115 [Photobacterium kishitanii]
MTKMKRKSFKIMIIATMSSGKSTLINAMLGGELLPSKNEACTAVISKIFHVKNRKKFISRLIFKDGGMSHWSKTNLNLLGEYNDQINSKMIETKGKIKFIKENIKKTPVFIDTPGPNNSRDDFHREETYQALSNEITDLIIYVLNATQLGTDDDKYLIDYLKEDSNRVNKTIFVVNKVDCLDSEAGESISNMLDVVKNYLEGSGINKPTIIPVSAGLAKLLRMQENGVTLTRLQRNRLAIWKEIFLEDDDMNLLNHSKKYLNDDIYHKLKIKTDSFKYNSDDIKLAEMYSGVPILEAYINNLI